MKLKNIVTTFMIGIICFSIGFFMEPSVAEAFSENEMVEDIVIHTHEEIGAIIDVQPIDDEYVVVAQSLLTGKLHQYRTGDILEVGDYITLMSTSSADVIYTKSVMQENMRTLDLRPVEMLYGQKDLGNIVIKVGDDYYYSTDETRVLVNKNVEGLSIDARVIFEWCREQYEGTPRQFNGISYAIEFNDGYAFICTDARGNEVLATAIPGLSNIDLVDDDVCVSQLMLYTSW